MGWDGMARERTERLGRARSLMDWWCKEPRARFSSCGTENATHLAALALGLGDSIAYVNSIAWHSIAWHSTAQHSAAQHSIA